MLACYYDFSFRLQGRSCRKTSKFSSIDGNPRGAAACGAHFGEQRQVVLHRSRLAGFEAPALDERGGLRLPDGLVFMDDPGASFPEPAGHHHGFAQGELSAARGAAFFIQCVQFFEVDQEGVFFTERVFHG